MERYVKMALERRRTLNKLKKVLGILVLVGVIMFGQIGMNWQAASQLQWNIRSFVLVFYTRRRTCIV